MFIAKLKADFAGIDVDNSGFVTRANLQEMASQTNYVLSQEELDHIIKDMDGDGDGKISIEEFIASAVRIRMSLALETISN
jgi:Ca2+-binding EF-hand superfamily protein